MKKSFINACRKFILLLKNRKHSRDITIFYEDKWYESAFSTVARPLGNIKKADGENYRKWHDENYGKMKERILDLLSRLSPNGTVSIYDEMQKIAKACDVPLGVVQKIVGIMMKYVVTNYYGEFDSASVGEKYPWVKDEEFVKKLPIPVDSKVLWNLKEHGSTLNITQIGGYAKIDGLPWSRIDIDIYKKIQEEVARMAGDDGMLGFEMNNLWR